MHGPYNIKFKLKFFGPWHSLSHAAEELPDKVIIALPINLNVCQPTSKHLHKAFNMLHGI
jgi:hypothetical protein